jgi:hypothetical protein
MTESDAEENETGATARARSPYFVGATGLRLVFWSHVS